MVSVVMPARNEGERIAATIRSAARARTGKTEIEFVVADDQSTDDSTTGLDDVVRRIPRARLTVCRSGERLGVPRARNFGASKAAGDILFITDAHVRFSPGWDEHVLEHVRPKRVLATTITDGDWSANGCVLAVPFMGTYWNYAKTKPLDEIQVAACPGTVLPRKLFDELGGYDEGMLYYAAAEPEFSVRAWLSGACVLALPQVRIEHRFKPKEENDEFMKGLRPYMVHNAIRFGMVYLDDELVLQQIRQHSLLFGEEAREGLKLVVASDIVEHREKLRASFTRDFAWFVQHFKLKDQAGREIPTRDGARELGGRGAAPGEAQPPS
jgi:glycosyltransferase involved in cell wall biosynthesis